MCRSRLVQVFLWSCICFFSVLDDAESFLFKGSTSCARRCNATFRKSDLCHCNSKCLRYNNCCSDYQALCTAVTPQISVLSCAGRCGTKSDNPWSCQCNAGCEVFNDCCGDYSVLCNPFTSTSIPATTSETALTRTTAAVVTTSQGSSCAGRCTLPYNKSDVCHCNAKCLKFNNCCSDYGTSCKPTASSHAQGDTSCKGRCGSTAKTTQPCQCNSHCEKFNDCCDDYSSVCGLAIASTIPTTTTTTTIATTTTEKKECQTTTAVAEQLWTNDANGLGTGDMTLNFQARVPDIKDHEDATDRAPKKLFAYVNGAKLTGPTFTLFRALRNNYNPKNGRGESISQYEKEEMNDFLQAVLNTNVMRVLLAHAICKGWVKDKTDFGRKLWKTWFELYPRNPYSNKLDSSGFEHVMLGEHKYSPEPIVNGYHNWISFYEDEKAGELNYYGYVSRRADVNLVGASFLWHQFYKAKGAFLIGVSPEFDMALYSLCYWTTPGETCTFTLGGTKLQMQTYDANGHLGTAYIH